MRLIDADALWKEFCRSEAIEERYGSGVLEIAGDIIDNAPTIDAEPIVRCKDCKRCHRFADDSNSNMKSWCLKFSLSKRVNDDDFCAWGERKDNG